MIANLPCRDFEFSNCQQLQSSQELPSKFIPCRHFQGCVFWNITLAASQGNSLCSILSSKYAPRMVQPSYANTLAHTSTCTYALAPAHTSTRTYAHALALPGCASVSLLIFDYFPTLTMLPQGCEDPLALTMDRPLCLRLTGTPTPPKCRPGANMAPINDPRI